MRLVRLAPIGALALTVEACGTLRPASVGGGECRVFERPEYAVLGQTRYDQNWIDSNTRPALPHAAGTSEAKAAGAQQDTWRQATSTRKRSGPTSSAASRVPLRPPVPTLRRRCCRSSSRFRPRQQNRAIPWTSCSSRPMRRRPTCSVDAAGGVEATTRRS